MVFVESYLQYYFQKSLLYCSALRQEKDVTKQKKDVLKQEKDIPKQEKDVL